jgi:exopolysaccharide biosynthesis polyprenyl glycosylphosphotransferase
VTIEATPAPAGAQGAAPARPPLFAIETTPPRAGVLARLVRATLLRFGISPYLLFADVVALAAGIAAVGGLTGGLLVLGLTTLALYATAGLYRSRLNLSVLDQVPELCVRSLASVAVASLIDVAVTSGRHLTLAVAGGVALAASMVCRTVVVAGVRAARRHRLIEHPTLVLGAGQVGRQIATAIVEHPEYGLKVLGFVDSDPLLPDEERPAPLLGRTDELARVIVETGARHVVIGFAALPSSAMVDIVRTCDRLECELFIVPRLFELHHRSGNDVEVVWGMPLLRLRRAPFRRVSWRVKRVIDVVVAAATLVLASPLFLAIAVAVRREGGPGVIFRQERVGVDGRSFTCLKFRSMRPADSEESETRWNIAGDDRIGPLGAFLRRSSLDELPQLWNVLRGDMSLVGPRPERPHFVDQFAVTLPRYLARHRVPCGMTGWSQVHGLRGDTSVADRARFDNYYIENWSLWLDLKIVLRTFGVVLGREGR